MVRRALCAVGPPKALTPEEQCRLLAALENAAGREAQRDKVLNLA